MVGANVSKLSDHADVVQFVKGNYCTMIIPTVDTDLADFRHVKYTWCPRHFLGARYIHHVLEEATKRIEFDLIDHFPTRARCLRLTLIVVVAVLVVLVVLRRCLIPVIFVVRVLFDALRRLVERPPIRPRHERVRHREQPLQLRPALPEA